MNDKEIITLFFIKIISFFISLERVETGVVCVCVCEREREREGGDKDIQRT